MNADAIRGAVLGATKKWAKQRKKEERAANQMYRRREVWNRSARVTIKDAAYAVMEKAYLHASANNTLPATARQVMYAARKSIQSMTGRTLDDQYFTQVLLPDYQRDHPNKTATWDVVFDARGSVIEPHTGKRVPLGTLNVRKYLLDVHEGTANESAGDDAEDLLDNYPTIGPAHRYGAILFIEKEGFAPLFEHVKLADRFDIAIMSTKGMSVTACRQLIDTLCAEHSIPLFVLHDFDKSGFSIVGTLQRDTRRYEFANDVKVIDLGLRLEDVQENGLPSEEVVYGKSDPMDNLIENGATGEEIEFLCEGAGSYRGRYHGQRVELNAFASDQLVAWIEGKLEANGVKKIVPDDDTLEAAYRRAARMMYMKSVIEEADDPADDFAQQIELPRSLKSDVLAHLKEHPKDSWDEAIAAQARLLEINLDKGAA